MQFPCRTQQRKLSNKKDLTVLSCDEQKVPHPSKECISASGGSCTGMHWKSHQPSWPPWQPALSVARTGHHLWSLPKEKKNIFFFIQLETLAKVAEDYLLFSQGSRKPFWYPAAARSGSALSLLSRDGKSINTSTKRLWLIQWQLPLPFPSSWSTMLTLKPMSESHISGGLW